MLSINPEFKKLIPPLTADEFQQLEANCLSEGIRDAIVVWNGYILDGHNRYEIATKHGLEYRTVEKHFESETDAKIWMIYNQFGRRNLNAWKRSILALELEDVFKEKAKENLILSGKLFGELHNKANIIENDIQEGLQISANPLIEPIDTRKELAKAANVSHDTIAKVKVIEAKATPEVKEQLLAGDISINEAYKEIKQEEKRAELLDKVEIARAKISEAEKLGVPDSFGVVVIDPPWDYSERGGFVTDNYNADSNRGAVDYPTMTISEIAKIQIPAADDCVLFLWTTHKFLEDSFSLIRGWGFDYKATIVWDKMKMGIGRTIRLQCEFCLLATKGNPIILGGSERDIISEARREHSRKPEAFYSMVERMTVGSKIDYFSREYRLNWFSYGAELGKF